MAEISPRDLLACIRYEFQRGNPFCDALKNFYEVFGNDAMTFGNFEFWWYRFKEGNFDLDYEGPPKPGLSDISLDIVETIIGNLEWKERCIFRKVSKTCRKVVDSVSYTFSNVCFRDYMFEGVILINDTRISYCQKRNDHYDTVFIETKSEDFIKRALNDLFCILKNPNNQIKLMVLNFNSYKTRKEMKCGIRSISHQIHVEKLILVGGNDRRMSPIYVQNEVVSFLPHLKPGVLKDIGMEWPVKELILEDVAKLNQWKQAKKFETKTSLPKNFDYINHFNHLDVRFNLISSGDLIQLTNIFSNSPNFHSAIIRYAETEENVMQQLGWRGFDLDSKNVVVKLARFRYEFSKKKFPS